MWGVRSLHHLSPDQRLAVARGLLMMWPFVLEMCTSLLLKRGRGLLLPAGIPLCAGPLR